MRIRRRRDHWVGNERLSGRDELGAGEGEDFFKRLQVAILHLGQLVVRDLVLHALLERLVDAAGVEDGANAQHVEHLVLHLVQHVILTQRN